MFTGLIDDVGTVAAVASTPNGREFRVVCRYRDLKVGESIALNGACLTVRGWGDDWFSVAAVVTTLDRTTIAQWEVGRRLNLERALKVDDRLGGHIVQGHVDGVGEIVSRVQRGDALLLDVAVPSELAELLVLHGSVAVDGVSLTVNALPSDTTLQLSLIEHTLRHTTLGGLAVGNLVHIETDMIGKHVRRLLAPYLTGVGSAIRND